MKKPTTFEKSRELIAIGIAIHLIHLHINAPVKDQLISSLYTAAMKLLEE